MPSSSRDQHRAKRTGRPFLSLLFTLLLSNAYADEAYDLGVAAFNRGAYEEAVDHFLAAQGGNPNDPDLQYNLGASYYKLGRYEEAGQAFLEVIKYPEMAPLAYYNLALVAARLNQPNHVISWLQRAIDSSDNPKLQSLAHTMLERYSSGEESPEVPSDSRPEASPWWGFVTGKLGYDSNVILLSDNQTLSTSERDDLFVDVSGYINRRFPQAENDLRVNVDASAYIIKYQDIGGYDVDSLRLGGSVGKALSDWFAEAGAHMAYTFLDGNEFTLEPQFSMSANRWLKPGRSRLRLHYEISHINPLDDLYGYLSGWRHKTDARMTWIHGEQQLHLMYQLEANYREKLFTPRFTSYSPIRNSLRLLAETPVNNTLDAAIEVQYYYSHYLNPNELADGSFITRSDDRLSATARLTHRFRGGNELSIEYRRIDNKSNIDDYDYAQYLTMLGLLLSF
jgi:tetratricopeptide (TPR) repeat protein